MNPIPIPFPLGGIDKRRSYQSGDTQTTVGAVNVVPDSSEEGRTRGGVRQGISKAFSENTGAASFLAFVDSTTFSTDTPVRYLVAGSGTSVMRSQSRRVAPVGGSVSYQSYLEAVGGSLGGTGTLLGSGAQSVASRAELLLIADTGEKILEGTNGTMSSGVLTISEDTADVNLADHLLYVEESGCPHITAGVYKITAKTTNTLTVERASGLSHSGNVGSGAISRYFVRKGPKYVDLRNDTSGLFFATKGLAPTGGNVVAIYRDRAVWAEDLLWYMSRAGDVYDYDFGADINDIGRAVAGSNSAAGQPGRPIIAMAPAGDDYLVMFAEDATFVMRGDPNDGGRLDTLSRQIGCVDKNAWEFGPEGELYFLSKEGLYVIPYGAGAKPIAISNRRLPRELRSADRDNFTTSIVYDSHNNGLFVFVTPRNTGDGYHWWYDIETQSFWPLEFADDTHQPVAAVAFGPNPTQARQVFIACKDGYVRVLGDGGDDDGGSIESHVILGPFPGGESVDLEAMLVSLVVTLGEGSGAVTCELYRGDSAEEAADNAIAGASPFYSSPLTAGRSGQKYPRMRCAAWCMKLKSSVKWSFESLSAKMLPSGLQRL